MKADPGVSLPQGDNVNRLGSRWVYLAPVALAQFIITTDIMVVNIALPSIQMEIGLTDATRHWVVAGYSMVFACLLIPAGRIADAIGHRRSFLFGLQAFAVASIVAGLATEPVVLLAGRVAQGAAGAFVSPSALALISSAFPTGRARTKALSVYSAVAGSGFALGLIMGGLLTEYLGWRWALWIGAPFALAAAAAGVTLLPQSLSSRGQGLRASTSILPFLVLVSAVAAGIPALEGAHTIGMALMGVAGVALVGLVLTERRSRSPLFPADIVADPQRIGSYLVVGLVVMGLFGLLMVVTFHLQDVRGYSPLMSGLAFLPLVASMAAGSILISGRYAHRRPRLLVVAGLGLAVVAVVLLRSLDAKSSFLQLLLPAEVLLGIGVGLVLVPCTNASTYGLSVRRVGLASAIFGAAQQLGAAVGTIALNLAAVRSETDWRAANPGADAQQITTAGLMGALSLAVVVLVAAAVPAIVLLRPQASTYPLWGRS